MRKIQSIRIIISIISALLWSSLTYGEITVATGVRFDTFREQMDEDGAEDKPDEGRSTTFTLPVGIQYQYGKHLTVSLETAFSRAKDAETTISTITDALLAIHYVIPGLPIPVMAGIMVNLPTGKEKLDQDEQNVMEEESETKKFGQGLNIGFQISMAKKFQSWTVGLNGQYAYKGGYDSTEDVPDDEFDSGDHLMLNAKIERKISPRLTLGTSVAYLHVWPDKIGGAESFQEGATLTLGGNVRATLQPIVIGVNLQYKIPRKSKYQEEGELAVERQNSKGNTLGISVIVSYPKSQTLSFRGVLVFQQTAESKRKELDWPYAGKRTQYSFGPGVAYAITPSLQCTLSANYVHISQERDINTTYDKTTRGFKFDFGASYRFK